MKLMKWCIKNRNQAKNIYELDRLYESKKLKKKSTISATHV